MSSLSTQSEVLPIYPLTALFCLEELVNTTEDLTRRLSADEETSRETTLVFPRETEKSNVWFLCGNPNYLLMPSFHQCVLQHSVKSTSSNFQSFHFSRPTPLRSQDGKEKRKKDTSLRMSSGHWGRPSIHTSDPDSHQHERAHKVLCWQIPPGLTEDTTSNSR